MPAERRDPSVELVQRLQALAHPARLAILSHTRRAVLASHLEILGSDGAPISRQAVQSHVKRLVEAGLLHAQEAPVRGKQRILYEAEAARLFALSEVLRELATRLPSGHDDEHTITGMAVPVRSPRVTGPHLVVVHGVAEGAVFPLAKRAAGADGWLLGRDTSCAVALADDPTVSRHSAAIQRDLAGRYHLARLPASKSTVEVNWDRLGDQRHRLRNGDLIRLGQTKLVFRGGD